jgi:hypothetical protein
MFGLMAIGISISVIHLGPIWQERNELTRFANYGSQLHNGLGIQDFPALFLSNRLIIGEPSMTSTFVTLPMLVFASFIPIAELKKHWVFIVVLVLSVLMVAGPNSPFWKIITSAVPTMKLSRFPSSDYRVFVAIPIIVLGIAGLKAIIERGLSWRELLFRAAFVIAWFSVGLYLLYSAANPVAIQRFQVLFNSEFTAAAFVFSVTFLFIIYYMRKDKVLQNSSTRSTRIILSGMAVLAIFLLISFDGFRVISDMQTWKEIPFNKLYINNNVPLEKDGKLITYSIFQNIPLERPARETTDPVKDPLSHVFTWMGYLQGTYKMQDYTNEILNARSIAESNNIYRQYMLMKWTPILLEPNFVKSHDSTKIILPVSTFSNLTESQIQAGLGSEFTCDSAFSNKNLIQPKSLPAPQKPDTADQVIQTRYGINEISYKVTLKEPKLMVENELYFPGWQADLIFPDKAMKLQASVVNDVFRAWLLPAGDYIMIADFHFPNLIIYQSIAIISFGVWIFIIVTYWRRLDGNSKQRIKREGFITPP